MKADIQTIQELADLLAQDVVCLVKHDLPYSVEAVNVNVEDGLVEIRSQGWSRDQHWVKFSDCKWECLEPYAGPHARAWMPITTIEQMTEALSNVVPRQEGLQWWSERTTADIIRELRQAMETMTPDRRIGLISDLMQPYCRHCGTDNPSCQCWNDE